MNITSNETEQKIGCSLKVDVNKSVSRELERCCERLIQYIFNNLADCHSEKILEELSRIISLRQYFKEIELPANHYENLGEIE